MRIVFAANVVGAGSVGLSCLLAPSTWGHRVFSRAAPASHAMTLIGAVWTAIAILSAIGFVTPRPMVPVLALQWIYKGIWLAVVALPWLIRGRPKPFPVAMSTCFLVWFAVLTWAIPWRTVWW